MEALWQDIKYGTRMLAKPRRWPRRRSRACPASSRNAAASSSLTRGGRPSRASTCATPAARSAPVGASYGAPRSAPGVATLTSPAATSISANT